MKKPPTLVAPSRRRWLDLFGLLMASAAVLSPSMARANGLGENGSYQFLTSQDRVNKGAVLDLIQRKKGGFYDSFKTTNYNSNYTYVDKQVNCLVSATSSGNGGTNGISAATSSPTVNNTGTTSADTNANAATNGLSQAGFPGFPGVLVAGANTAVPYGGSLGNNQSNSGALNSAVSGSSTNAATGAIAAGSGVSDQVLNSNQSNTGSQAATVSGSTACNGSLTAK